MDIKKLREILGFSQQKLADVVGVKNGTVCRWETGKTIPSALAMNKLREIQKQSENKAEKENE